jgi:hypothetical protein
MPLRHAVGIARWYALELCDETFFRTAPFVYRYPVELDVSPERLWESLTSDRALADWRLGLHSLRWASPRPFGVGTTREPAEDYLVEKLPVGNRLTRTIAMEPTPRAKLLLRVSSPLNALACRAVPRRAKAYVAKNP